MTAWVLFAALFMNDGSSNYMGPFAMPEESICRKRQTILEAHIEARVVKLNDIHAWQTWCLPVNLGHGV